MTRRRVTATALIALPLALASAAPATAAPSVPVIAGPISVFREYDAMSNSLEIQGAVTMRVTCPAGQSTGTALRSSAAVETTLDPAARLVAVGAYLERPDDEGFEVVDWPTCTGKSQSVWVYLDVYAGTEGDEETRNQGRLVTRRATLEFPAGTRSARVVVDESLSNTF